MTIPNLLILGTGRSGTSIVCGAFAESGRFLGNNYIAARKGNPSGFFEDSHVNKTNAQLIQRMPPMVFERRWHLPQPVAHRKWETLWLATPFVRRFPRGLFNEAGRMLKRFEQQPFCYKDPRFCMTLPYWKPHLPANTKFIVVFRDPGRTAASMIREGSEFYTPPFVLTKRWCFWHWWRMYRWALCDARGDRSHWLFVKFDDVVSGRARKQLSAFSGTEVQLSHIDPGAVQDPAQHPVPWFLRPLWRRLCKEAEDDARRFGGAPE